MPRTKNPKPQYSVSPGVKMLQNWIATLEDKTGRTLDEWLDLARSKGPKEVKALRDWLKSKHGLGTNAAWWIAERSLGLPGSEGEDTPEAYLKTAVVYVDDQYAGKKKGLRPIYDRLLELGLEIGDESKACPCKTMVPFYRNHVFANITPSTNSRVDLGLALAKVPEGKIPKRLIDTGGKAKKDRITHRIPIESVDLIDAFVEKWLKAAYDLDA